MVCCFLFGFGWNGVFISILVCFVLFLLMVIFIGVIGFLVGVCIIFRILFSFIILCCCLVLVWW